MQCSEELVRTWHTCRCSRRFDEGELNGNQTSKPYGEPDSDRCRYDAMNRTFRSRVQGDGNESSWLGSSISSSGNWKPRLVQHDNMSVIRVTVPYYLSWVLIRYTTIFFSPNCVLCQWRLDKRMNGSMNWDNLWTVWSTSTISIWGWNTSRNKTTNLAKKIKWKLIN